MQFKVPQNIDLEDKIVGPLTLIQFLYLLVGGIIDYLLLTLIGLRFVFWILAIPIALIALALAFLKIQDQPLSHFVKAGLIYLSKPKVRIWQRQGKTKEIVYETKEHKKKEAPLPPKQRIEKSQLEQLAYVLDTQSEPREQNFGKVTKTYEKMLQGGRRGPVGKGTPTTQQYPRTS